MTRRHLYKTNFTGGELDPRLLGRGDLKAYENGAGELTNVLLHPAGGVSRRPGTRFLAELPGPGRLIAFEVSAEETYLLAFTSYRLDVYRDGALVAGNLAAPWHHSLLGQIAWVQSADTLIVTHPETVPRLIARDAGGAWTIDQIRFAQVGKRHMAPYARFAAAETTLAPAATTGTGIRIAASADVFQSGHVGARLRLSGGEALIQTVVDARNVDVEVTVDFETADATADWRESAFSQARGWPVIAAFHQNRLVLGGGRDLPNHLWLSKTDDLFNFDLGGGLDDEAIHFALLSDQVNAVRGLLSGPDLQVFTSGAEWRVTGDPLTPSSVQVKRQSRVGSRSDRVVPPRVVDNSTLFVARGGDGLYEFAPGGAGQGHLASDLSLLAQHLVRDLIEIDYEPQRRLLYGVLGDGGLAVLTQYRFEGVTAWSRMTTDGEVTALAVAAGAVHLLVARDNGTFLEVLDDELLLDAAVAGAADPPAAVWSGLDHLEGQTVALVADGQVKAGQPVVDGSVTLATPAAELVAGLPYTHAVAPLPPLIGNALGIGHGLKVRLIEATFRLQETADLCVDTGAGPQPLPFAELGGGLLDQPIASYSGDKSVRALGWRAAGTDPLWRIVGERPLPMTLLSVTTEIKVND